MKVSIDEQQNAIFNKYSTRLAEPYITYKDFLPEFQTIQTMALKFIIRTLMNDKAEDVGVRDFTTALTQSTPVFNPIRGSFNFDPIVYPLSNIQELFSGTDAHVWIPNSKIANWTAFIKYIDNLPDLFSLESVSESEVVLDYGGVEERHRFDFETDDYSTNFGLHAFDNIRVSTILNSSLLMRIFAASYTLDLVVRADSPLGDSRPYFDSGRPFDSGVTFDADYVDPLADGFVGLPLTGRFEQDVKNTYDAKYGFDTIVQPSLAYNQNGVYPDGFYTQFIGTQNDTRTLTIDIGSTGDLT
jgi:hypothetical protein